MEKEYTVGKYTYKSKQEFVNVVGIVFTAFFVCGYFIAFMKALMNSFIYYFSISICLIMMIHLIFKYRCAKGISKNYKFMDY